MNQKFHTEQLTDDIEPIFLHFAFSNYDALSEMF
jgi:hypothetical protein